MKILANPFVRQWEDTHSDVVSAVERVGQSGWYILGPEVGQFESDLATYAGVQHGIGCASGLDALEIGLRALGVKAGDRVLTTPLSAFATTLAVMRAGATPVFVDVDPSGLLDLDQAEAYFSAHADTRFCLPVHLFGHCLDLERLEAMRDRYELNVVEDCAQAIGAEWKGRRATSVGQVSGTSFYPTKNLGALGDGGAMLTNQGDLAEVGRSMRDYGQTTKYEHVRYGMNSRLDELHAAVMRTSTLPRLAGWTERRRTIARRYQSGLDHPDVRVVPKPVGSESVWHLFPVLVTAERRDGFMAHLTAAGVQAGIHYPKLIPEQGALEGYGNFHVEGALPMARRFAREEVSLPASPYLRDDEIDAVIAAVNAWKP